MYKTTQNLNETPLDLPTPIDQEGLQDLSCGFVF